MRRRVVFLAALGLAACTADLPTEPSLEGAPLQMALPPIPAPPEELTGDLTGGDGFGGFIELGVYASPVLSRITVTGLLTYQGTGSGYLAGNGQIDAAGFFIPNQCSLIVKVRQVNASGGQVVGGPVNCPAHPTQQGSYENYAVVNGSVSAYQTAGPPGSCWKTAPPCISITGSRSVTVEPLDAELVLTPNKVVVAAGGGIVVTAKAALGDPIAGNPAVPFTFREWKWEGQGPEVGGGHTKVCAAYNTNQCTVQMYQSGNLVGTAIVNGRLKEQRVFLVVVGGDSIPTPPDDSLPEEPPGDSLPGGGGGGDDECPAATSGASLAAGDSVVVCDDPAPPPPVAVIECSGTTGLNAVVRGADVTCTVKVTPSQAFTVTSWTASPEGGSTQSFVDAQVLSGPAIVTTTVGATILLADSTALTATVGQFAVQARPWPKYQLPTRPPELHRRTFDDGEELTRGTIRDNPVLGAFVLRGTDFNYVPVAVASSGPNKGYAYLEIAPVLQSPHIYTHPQFGGGVWFDDQDGGVDRSTQAVRCQAEAIHVLESRVEEHEGATMGPVSHWNIAHEILEFSEHTSTLEALIGPDGDPKSLQRRANARFLLMWNRLHESQVYFDSHDRPRVFGSLGCALDMDPNPGDG